MDRPWKNETWPSKRPQKIGPFFQFFNIFRTVHVHKVFEGLNDVSWSTEFNDKETCFVLSTILEKIWKNCKKGPIFFGPFWWSSLIFSRTVYRNEFLFFALQSVHQDASFELSNRTIRWFSIFTLVRGDPFNLGGVWALPQGDGLVKNGFWSVFLGPYGIPHAYKCQAKKFLNFFYF